MRVEANGKRFEVERTGCKRSRLYSAKAPSDPSAYLQEQPVERLSFPYASYKPLQKTTWWGRWSNAEVGRPRLPIDEEDAGGQGRTAYVSSA